MERDHMDGPIFDLHTCRVRFKILKALMEYDAGHPFVSLERAELINELNLDETELDEGIKYLQDKMLIETVWFMGGDYWTKISRYGIDAVYIAEKEPHKGTKYFPPVNIMSPGESMEKELTW